MRLLPKTQTEYYCIYLSDFLFEELDDIVTNNINSFIAEDREYRLNLIKSEINLEIIPDYIATDYTPLTQIIFKNRALYFFDKEMEKVIEEYKEKGETMFSDIGELEKWFARAFINQITSFETAFPELIKGQLKFIHYQEVERRNRIKKKSELVHLLLDKDIKDSVIEQFRRFKEHNTGLSLDIGKWKHVLFEKLVHRVDRAHQRYIPNKFLSRKEVVTNILKRINVLDKKLKSLESKLNKKKAKKGTTLHNETIIALLENKMEIDFYNKFLLESLAAVAEEENAQDPKLQQKIGTINQQNLMVYYLLEYAKIMDHNVTNIVYADLIQFLTGKSHGSIRKRWASTKIKSSGKERIKDLEVVRGFLWQLMQMKSLK